MWPNFPIYLFTLREPSGELTKKNHFRLPRTFILTHDLLLIASSDITKLRLQGKVVLRGKQFYENQL